VFETRRAHPKRGRAYPWQGNETVAGVRTKPFLLYTFSVFGIIESCQRNVDNSRLPPIHTKGASEQLLSYLISIKTFNFPLFTMAGDPRETWAKLQRTLAQAQQQGKKGFSGMPGGGNPRGAIGGIAGLILLGGAVLVGNNALFNGVYSILLYCIWQANEAGMCL
jgi:hypothetical protein